MTHYTIVEKKLHLRFKGSDRKTKNLIISRPKDKLKKAIKDGLSEDLEKDAEADLQKIHDKFIKQVDTLLEDKQKEIMTV